MSSVKTFSKLRSLPFGATIQVIVPCSVMEELSEITPELKDELDEICFQHKVTKALIYLLYIITNRYIFRFLPSGMDRFHC